MAALTRKFKKIFGKDSVNNGVFGSAAALAPATSTNPETIESLAAFLTGWEDATEGGLRLPTLQDMQGLKYDTDYHLAYIYQTGMQVYNSQTTYYTNDLVRKDATTEIWKSLVDDNTGNALVNGSNWTLIANLADIPTSPIVDASTTAKGIVELATNAEVTAGTDTSRAIVPSAFAASKFNAVNLISSQTASSSASVSFTGLNSDYSKYRVEFYNVLPATNAVTFKAEISIDSGATFISTGYDVGSRWQTNADLAGGFLSTSHITLSGRSDTQATWRVYNGAGYGVSGYLEFDNPSAPSTQKNFRGWSQWVLSDTPPSYLANSIISGRNTSTTSAINALRFSMSSGNIASGTFKLFGII